MSAVAFQKLRTFSPPPTSMRSWQRLTSEKKGYDGAAPVASLTDDFRRFMTTEATQSSNGRQGTTRAKTHFHPHNPF
jgi:hypothetical protein